MSLMITPSITVKSSRLPPDKVPWPMRAVYVPPTTIPFRGGASALLYPHLSRTSHRQFLLFFYSRGWFYCMRTCYTYVHMQLLSFLANPRAFDNYPGDSSELLRNPARTTDQWPTL